MKRFHIHTHVEDLQASIAFYSPAGGPRVLGAGGNCDELT